MGARSSRKEQLGSVSGNVRQVESVLSQRRKERSQWSIRDETRKYTKVKCEMF